MIVYREAKRTEQAAIVELLTASFMDYAYYKLYVDQEEKRQKFVRVIQELCVKTSMRKGYPILVGLIDDVICSVAILVPPKAPKVSLIDYILAGGLTVLRHGGIKDTAGFLGMLEESNSVCHSTYPDAWFLELFAVSNSFQGQGVGGKMLNEFVIPYIANQGGGMLTFITNSEVNRRFYKKNGFIEFHAGEIHRRDKVLYNWSYQKHIVVDRT